ncbi:MAG TPA: hypothetical protein VIX42_05510, partial [Edaphobacter sp.]
ADDGYLLGLDEGEVCVCVVVGLCHFEFSLESRYAVKSKMEAITCVGCFTGCCWSLQSLPSAALVR